MTAKYAMTASQVRMEHEAIQACWDELSPLDTKARYRVIQWLQMWAHSEAPDDEKSGLGMF